MKPITSNAEIISTYQIRADKIAYEYLKLKDKFEAQRKFNLLNDFVDFNASLVLPFICPLLVSQDAINFVLKNGGDLKRKLTILELIDFSEKLNLLALFKINPSGFEEFKKMSSKIKPCIKNQEK
jgi:hypothetical protein